MNRTISVIGGTVLIILSFVIVGVGIWEGINNVRENYFEITAPGFHELNFKSAGLYAGVYQHRTRDPIPKDTLSQMEFRIFTKGDFQEVPVFPTPIGQSVGRLEQVGLPIFSFAIEQPGPHTMSGFYMGEGEVVPIPIFIFAQAAQDVKQTIIVAGAFFLIFFGLGIYLCIWGGKPPKPAK